MKAYSASITKRNKPSAALFPLDLRLPLLIETNPAPDKVLRKSYFQIFIEDYQ